MAMYDADWYIRTFAPLIKRLHKKGVNIYAGDRFNEAVRKDNPELVWYQRDNSAEWKEMVDECLSM